MELTKRELEIIRYALNVQIEDEEKRGFYTAALQTAILRDRIQDELDASIVVGM